MKTPNTLHRARARARKKSAGAALFVVAITLGLLAVMGVYGLTTTAQDVRAAGQIRQATQAQHMAESGVILTAETMTPGVSGEVIRLMHAPPQSAGGPSQGRLGPNDCKTGKPWTGDVRYENAEACKVIEWEEMRRITAAVTPWTAGVEPATVDPSNALPIRDRSFGHVDVWPVVRIELTNPDYWEQRNGTSQNVPFTYAEIRATVFVDMKPKRATLAATRDQDSLTVGAGRGRLVVGPYIR